MIQAGEGTKLGLAVLAVVGLNLPFGWLRAGVARFTRRWLLYVHLPVPAVVALRLLLGLGWHWTTYPLLIGAYAAGQLGGGWLRRRVRR